MKKINAIPRHPSESARQCMSKQEIRRSATRRLVFRATGRGYYVNQYLHFQREDELSYIIMKLKVGNFIKPTDKSPSKSGGLLMTESPWFNLNGCAGR